jgi:hypothetical protein
MQKHPNEFAVNFSILMQSLYPIYELLRENQRSIGKPEFLISCADLSPQFCSSLHSFFSSRENIIRWIFDANILSLPKQDKRVKNIGTDFHETELLLTRILPYFGIKFQKVPRRKLEEFIQKTKEGDLFSTDYKRQVLVDGKRRFVKFFALESGANSKFRLETLDSMVFDHQIPTPTKEYPWSKWWLAPSPILLQEEGISTPLDPLALEETLEYFSVYNQE